MFYYKTQSYFYYTDLDLRNKSWMPECVLSFNICWQILVFYPEPDVF
jgi:hypothetical protein